MQQSTACLHFAWRTTSLCVGVGRLGVAACQACVAAVVDWQARQCCRVVRRCELDDCCERVHTSNFLSATVLSY